MTFVPLEGSVPATPVTLGSFDHPHVLGLVQHAELLETDACPWPRIDALLAVNTDSDLTLLVWDIVDEWGDQSFPASDPPANW